MSTHLDRVAVWQRADGGLSITYFDIRDMADGEGEDAFIERMSAKHGSSELLRGAVRTIIGIDKVKTRNKDVRGFIGGEVIDDPSKVISKGAEKQDRDSILGKLKITEEEFAKLLKR